MAADGARSGHDRIMGHRQDLTLLSERIRGLRLAAGLTQEALAGRVGVTPAAVRSYEAGRAAPRPPHLEAMAEALGVRPEHLVTFRIDASDTLASALFQLGDAYGLDPVWYEGRAYLVPTSRFMAGLLSTWANWHEALTAGAVSREEYDAWRRRFAAPFDALDCPSRREESRERPAAGHRPGPHRAAALLAVAPRGHPRTCPPRRPRRGARHHLCGRWGAVGTLAQDLLGLALAEGSVAWHAARCMLCVALAEELCKLLAARRGCDCCRMEAPLCCVLAAIGFDLAENLAYSITATMAVTVVRALKSIAGHTLYGAIMGFMLGKAERARTRKGDATAWHVAAVAIPTALHGLYDLLLYTLPPSVAFASALTHCALGTVAAVLLVRRALGGRSACWGVTVLGRLAPVPYLYIILFPHL